MSEANSAKLYGYDFASGLLTTEKTFAQTYGYLFAIFTPGGGVGPFVMGAVYDRTGSYQTALIGFSCLLCLIVLLLTRLKRDYPYPVRHASAPSKTGVTMQPGW